MLPAEEAFVEILRPAEDSEEGKKKKKEHDKEVWSLKSELARPN